MQSAEWYEAIFFIPALTGASGGTHNVYYVKLYLSVTAPRCPMSLNIDSSQPLPALSLFPREDSLSLFQGAHKGSPSS
ncbi:hypothetical protein KPSA1_03509 [Pseudomonas syringae pv. actinidiae]|uniref:Uncharacterized protein n=1 Tax=Pseudomonas syringae pv. actinidiae TaxID=103796 RepID=A0A2V0QAU6_PSESF|nr:hypothetical protein KPSA1_03509 [Pseudomonas syringae pv. actinidiae]